jgi:hypothetical protein
MDGWMHQIRAKLIEEIHLERRILQTQPFHGTGDRQHGRTMELEIYGSSCPPHPTLSADARASTCPRTTNRLDTPFEASNDVTRDLGNVPLPARGGIVAALIFIIPLLIIPRLLLSVTAMLAT